MTIYNYFEKGGAIMYILFTLSIIGLTTIIWRWITLVNVRKNIAIYVEKIINLPKNGRKSELELFMFSVERGLNSIKTIATVSPLLGLLGTVLGIFDSFEKLSLQGNDSSFFAGGISTALLTTIAGLIVAIPHLIGYNYLIRKVDFIEKRIERDILDE
ncbi:MotA/TolQ/ExbB proton channel family protein [bacterium]|nr:MotA/TolQ/ExbB proton channel family protein [bacterium]